jgi:hypothetical protein
VRVVDNLITVRPQTEPTAADARRAAESAPVVTAVEGEIVVTIQEDRS